MQTTIDEAARLGAELDALAGPLGLAPQGLRERRALYAVNSTDEPITVRLEVEPLYYILDRQRQIVPATPGQHWRYLRRAELRRVANTRVRGARVSTVFLGGAHAPFETLVLGGRLDGQALYAPDWELAELMHELMVARVRTHDSPMRKKIRRMIDGH